MSTLSNRALRPAEPARSVTGSTVMTAATILLLAMPLVLTAAVVPKLEEVFKDFGVQLPVLTRMFIQVGRVVSTPLGWAGVMLAIVLVIAPASVLARQKRNAAWLLLMAAILIAAVYAVLLVVGMLIPVMQLNSSLQSGSAP